MNTKSPVIRSLSEDLERIGIKGGIDLSLAGLVEREDPDAKNDDADNKPKVESDDPVVKAVAESAFLAAKRVIRESDIDYDKVKFEADLKESILRLAEKLHTKNMTEAALSELVLDKLVESLQRAHDKKLEEKLGLGKTLDKLTEADLTEKVVAGNSRVIMARKGGRLVRKRQKLAARSVRIKRNRKDRKHRGRLKVKRAKWMRTGKAKKGMRLRKKAEARTPTNPKLESESLSPVERMRALLQEDSYESAAPLTESARIRESLEEAFDRVIRISDLLANFFEDHGIDEDLVLAESLTEMVEMVGRDRDSLAETSDGSVIESKLKLLQRYTSVVAEALDEFGRYKIVEAKAKEDEDEEDDEDEDDDWYDDEDEEDDEDPDSGE